MTRRNIFFGALVLAVVFAVIPLGFIGAQSEGATAGDCGANEICNPLRYGDLYEFIKAIVEVIAFIGVPISVFFIIYAGFLFVTAGGNETQLATAKKTLAWALVGAAVLLGAWVIASAIEGTINQLK